MKLHQIKACQKSLLLVILPKNQDFWKQLEIAIFEFFDFLHEVRTLKALQTGTEVALFV